MGDFDNRKLNFEEEIAKIDPRLWAFFDRLCWNEQAVLTVGAAGGATKTGECIQKRINEGSGFGLPSRFSASANKEAKHPLQVALAALVQSTSGSSILMKNLLTAWGQP